MQRIATVDNAGFWGGLIGGCVTILTLLINGWLKTAGDHRAAQAAKEAHEQSRLEARIDKLETEDANKAERIIGLERQNAMLTGSITTLQNTLNTHQQQSTLIIGRLQARVKAAETHITAWQQALELEDADTRERIRARLPAYTPDTPINGIEIPSLQPGDKGPLLGAE